MNRLAAVICAVVAMSNYAAFGRNNMDDVKQSVNDGWDGVIWGPHFDHASQAFIVAQMAAAPGSEVAWVLDMVAKVSAADASRKVILQVIRQRKPITHNKKEWDAGLATYNHWTEEKVPTLTPPNYRWVKVPRPNTFQPYIRYRKVNSSGNASSNGTASKWLQYTIRNDSRHSVSLLFTPTGNTAKLRPGQSTSARSPVKGNEYPKVKATATNGAGWERTIRKDKGEYRIVNIENNKIQVVP